MVKPDKDFVIHVASIVGLVVAAHHFWPKGITYGEKEHWEKAYRKRHRLRKHHEEHLKKHPEEAMYSRGYPSGARSERRVEENYGERLEERYDRVERPRYRDDDGFEYSRQIEYEERPRARY